MLSGGLVMTAQDQDVHVGESVLVLYAVSDDRGHMAPPLRGNSGRL